MGHDKGLVLLGAGGLEASLFTAEMFQMYQKYIIYNKNYYINVQVQVCYL